jgi:uncharacterized membrane protein
VDIIKYVFGVEGEGMTALIGIILALVLMVIVFIIMFKVDWEKRFGKYANAPQEDSGKASEDNVAE